MIHDMFDRLGESAAAELQMLEGTCVHVCMHVCVHVCACVCACV